MNARDDLSDTDVLSAVRDSLSGMPVASPPDVESIIARGRARRRRRLIPGATGTLALAAGAALAVTALAPASLPSGHEAGRQATRQAGRQATRQPTVRLAAWTVAKLANGNISVTIRELKDPAGLQSTLRADGVPASVTVASQQNPACQPYSGATSTLLKQVFPEPYGSLPLPADLPGGMHAVGINGRPPALPSLSANQTIVVIDPSALPGAAGVQLGVNYAGTAFLLPQVVYASSQCTGS